MTRRRTSRRLAEQVAERVAAGVLSWTFADALHKKKMMTTRHATYSSAASMVERDVEGARGGDLVNGPLDGRGNRGSNP